MNYFRPLLLLLLPLVLAACATSGSTITPQDVGSTQAPESFQPAPGLAGLYVLKEGSLIGVIDSYQVSLDGQMLGLVASNSYLYTPLTPGNHILTTDFSKLPINAEAGQNYFVRQTATVLDGQVLSSHLSLEPPEKGLEEVKRMQASNYPAH